MSRIHQTLYRSKNFSSINIGEYLRNLTDEIIELYAGKTKSNIKVSYILDEVSFNIKEAIPIGLIANEIITNAVKHAFPNDRMGEINIELKNHVDYVDLKIKDNGIGMNAINNEDTINTLGRELIHSLVEQINAEIKIENSQGLMYFIRIPLPKE